MLPALLNSVALAVALFIQSTANPLAGAWLLFSLTGCGILLYQNKYPSNHMATRSPCALWVATIGLCVFVLNPVPNGAYWGWVMDAMPLLAISILTPAQLKAHLRGFQAVLLAYALCLGAQFATGHNLGFINYGSRMAWPLIDPNNAAALMNAGLALSLYASLFGKRRYCAPTALFFFALVATGSRTGLAAAGLTMTILYTLRYGTGVLAAAIVTGLAGALAVFLYRPGLIADAAYLVSTRFDMWWAASRVIVAYPWRGVGLGQFGNGRVVVGSGYYFPPDFVHNDTMQIAAEMGLPAACVFVWAMLSCLRRARRDNAGFACAVLAVFVQSMMEFQFYLPAVNLVVGLMVAACYATPAELRQLRGYPAPAQTPLPYPTSVLGRSSRGAGNSSRQP